MAVNYWDISYSYYLWTNDVWGYNTISNLKPWIIIPYSENTCDTNMNLPLWKDSGFPPVGNPNILKSNH